MYVVWWPFQLNSAAGVSGKSFTKCGDFNDKMLCTGKNSKDNNLSYWVSWCVPVNATVQGNMLHKILSNTKHQKTHWSPSSYWTIYQTRSADILSTRQASIDVYFSFSRHQMLNLQSKLTRIIQS